MGGAVHNETRPNQPLQRKALLVGLVSLALCALAALIGSSSADDPSWFLDRSQFFRAYLVAYSFLLGLPLGSLAILMLRNLTGGAWGDNLRPILQTASRTTPLLAVLFLPLLLGLDDLYPWMAWGGETVPSSDLIEQKSLYLNAPFFTGRSIGYLLIWLVLAMVLLKWLADSAHHTEYRQQSRVRMLSAAGLLVYGLTITLAGIDWLMSLEPFWYSSIYSLIYASDQVLTAFSFSILAIIWLSPDDLPPAQGRDLGNLLLTFVMLWMYLSFSQYLLIWSANLPEEVTWYLKRLQGGWQSLALALVIFGFAFPFFALLSRNIKHNPRALILVAWVVLAMRYIDLYWIIMPAFHAYEGIHLHWMDVGVMLGLCGIWLGVFLRQWDRQFPAASAEATNG